MNFAIRSSHPALVRSVNFGISGNFPVTWITARISPMLVLAVFNHFATSSGSLMLTTWEWNLLLIASCRSLGVDSEMKQATFPPFFSTWPARNCTLSASALSVASTVKTIAFPAKSGW